jgi:hypothetical protein
MVIALGVMDKGIYVSGTDGYWKRFPTGQGAQPNNPPPSIIDQKDVFTINIGPDGATALIGCGREGQTDMLLHTPNIEASSLVLNVIKSGSNVPIVANGHPVFWERGTDTTAYYGRMKSTSKGQNGSWNNMAAVPSGFVICGASYDLVAGNSVLYFANDDLPSVLRKSVDRGASCTIVSHVNYNIWGTNAWLPFCIDEGDPHTVWTISPVSKYHIRKINTNTGAKTDYHLLNGSTSTSILWDIVSILNDPINPDILYVRTGATDTGQVFLMSTNGGSSFEDISAGTPCNSNSLGFNIQRDTGILIMFTTMGAYFRKPPYTIPAPYTTANMFNKYRSFNLPSSHLEAYP